VVLWLADHEAGSKGGTATLMATILLIGSDEALLEGLAQSLTALGHRALMPHDVSEAVDIATAQPPLLAVLGQAALHSDPRALRIPVLPGGALVLYRTVGEMATMVAGTHRNVLAELILPLERNRLLALVHHLEERVRVTGRELHRDTPTELPRI
jgi:DNA-binding NtrC family response regulator